MDVAHPRVFVRAILYANFFLFALFVMPITHHWIDHGFLALKSINLEEVVGRSMQVWIVASTIIATVLFGVMLWKYRRSALPITAVRFEGILLLTWWLTLLGFLAYGFMLGMGG
jgi:hypothetical protein